MTQTRTAPAQGASFAIDRLLAGFQPTGDGRLHIGNYFGSIEPFLRHSAGARQSFAMIADLHALSLGAAPRGLAQARLRCAKELIACGCADQGRFIFAQSDNPAISRVFALLSFHTPLGDLRRMTHYEEKKERARGEPAGLLLYPALMAADLMALGASHAAVGEDQTQHMELCAELCRKIELLYGERLDAPRALIPPEAARVKSLSSPEAKMSKSDPSPAGTLYLSEPSFEAERKIKRAQTDSERLPGSIAGLQGRVGALNLLSLLAACRGQSLSEALHGLCAEGFGVLKQRLSAALRERLEPIQARLAALSDEEALFILERGAQAARAVSEPAAERLERAILSGALRD